MHGLFRGLLFGAAAVALAGCSQVPAPVEPGGAARSESTEPAAPAVVAVAAGDENDLAGVLRQSRGKVVLVDYWGTWCGPCLELLPHTVELHHALGGRGLVVVTVAFDDRQDEAEVLDILEKHNATCRNFRSRYGAGSASWEKFGISGDVDAVPHVQVYDRSGKLRQSFGYQSGPFGSADIDKAVEQLLAETGA